MTIKAIREAYKDYDLDFGGRNSFVVYNYNDGNGKVVIIVNIHKVHGNTVKQIVRVSDGRELLSGRARPCDTLDDAVDVADEMLRPQ